MSAFSSNKGLFVYRQVKPFDTLVTRTLLEILVSLIASFMFIVIGLYLGMDISIKNFNMLIFALVWLCIFGFAIGLMNAVFSYFYEFYGKVIHIIMAPLLFVSALMYTVDSLPPLAREIVLYNPLVHFMEMIHGYYFHSLNTYYVDYEYMLYWTLIPLWIGLFFYLRVEKRILSS
jgi:capsular polysaccharide transport system permease protein